jgi:hypothetical protein
MIGSTSFVDKAVTTWPPCEAIVVVVEVSSPTVGSNVGHLFSNDVNQEQATQLSKIKDLRPLKHYLLLDIIIFRRRS